MLQTTRWPEIKNGEKKPLGIITKHNCNMQEFIHNEWSDLLACSFAIAKIAVIFLAKNICLSTLVSIYLPLAYMIMYWSVIFISWANKCHFDHFSSLIQIMRNRKIKWFSPIRSGGRNILRYSTMLREVSKLW